MQLPHGELRLVTHYWIDDEAVDQACRIQTKFCKNCVHVIIFT